GDADRRRLRRRREWGGDPPRGAGGLGGREPRRGREWPRRLAGSTSGILGGAESAPAGRRAPLLGVPPRSGADRGLRPSRTKSPHAPGPPEHPSGRAPGGPGRLGRVRSAPRERGLLLSRPGRGPGNVGTLPPREVVRSPAASGPDARVR